MIASVAVAAPGFINISLHQEHLWQEVKAAITRGDDYGVVDTSGKNIMLEYGCPNTHKMPHIGHLFSYCYGESMVRIREAIGDNVFRENYQGDVGLHVAKCLWAYMKKNAAGQLDVSVMTLAEKVQLLQVCYQEGSLAYDDDPAAKVEIDTINTQIYKHDAAIESIWQETRQWSIDYYDQFEQRIGVSQNQHYYESQTSQAGEKIVRENIGTVFEEDAGAVIFRGEAHDVHTRVFINGKGNPTYEAKDLGLISLKLSEDFVFDEAVYTTGNEQNDYFKVMFKTFNLIFPQTVNKLRHIGFGMLNLTTGKMSSRTGNVVTAIDLVEMVKERVRTYIKENREYDEAETENIAETVAIGAIKYSFLKSAATKNVSFDLESSIAFDGNSGPYLQYTYARCQSVLKKAAVMVGEIVPTDLSSEEQSILRWIYQFPEAIQEAANQYSPHVMANYIFELAQRYSVFYNNNQIITEDAAVTNSRLALTSAVAQVLKNGLYLMGIEVAEKI
jgi:arginyl-tRNA synthetase